MKIALIALACVVAYLAAGVVCVRIIEAVCRKKDASFDMYDNNMFGRGLLAIVWPIATAGICLVGGLWLLGRLTVGKKQ